MENFGEKISAGVLGGVRGIRVIRGIAEKDENAGGSTNHTTPAIIIAYDFAIPLPFRYHFATTA